MLALDAGPSVGLQWNLVHGSAVNPHECQVKEVELASRELSILTSPTPACSEWEKGLIMAPRRLTLSIKELPMPSPLVSGDNHLDLT